MMRTIKVFRCAHSFFQTNIGRLSSPGAVVPFAVLSDRSTSSSVTGCHGSSGSGEAGGLGSGVFIAGKNASRNAFALSSF
jgi:hypothetical protein